LPSDESVQAFDPVGRRCQINRDSLLEKLLALALELVVQDDAADARALAAQTLGSLHVGAIDL
jgi:hypothetical protein